jgi:hypothetical protein
MWLLKATDRKNLALFSQLAGMGADNEDTGVAPSQHANISLHTAAMQCSCQ